MPKRAPRAPRPPVIVEGASRDLPFDDRLTLLLEEMRRRGSPVTVASRQRTAEEQAKLYAQGRTAPGDIVTEKSGAPGDESRHQLGTASDLAFLQDGRASWSEAHDWDLLGEVAKAVGLEWGGDWTTLVDRPHVQLPRPGGPSEPSTFVSGWTDPASVRISYADPADAPAAVPLPSLPSSSPSSSPPSSLSDAASNGLEWIGARIRRRPRDIDLSPALEAEAWPVSASPADARAERPSLPTLPTLASAAPTLVPSAPSAPSAPPAPDEAPTAMPEQTLSNSSSQVVYVPGRGFVRAEDAVSGADMRQGADLPSAPRLTVGNRQAGFTPPTGMDAPPTDQDAEVWQKIVAASPQLAGLIGTFFPPVRALGATGAFAVPAATEALRQLITGEDMDALAMAGEGGLGVAGHGLGRAVSTVGRTGKNMVRRALFGGRPSASLKEVEGLTDLAIAEKAKLANELPGQGRIPGGDMDLMRRATVAENAGQTARAGPMAAWGSRTPGNLEALSKLVHSQALRARTGSSVLPQALAGGGMTGVAGTAAGVSPQVTAAVSPIVGAISAHAPTRMAVGSALTSPFGVSTEQTLGPAADRMIRTLMSWLESQQAPVSSHSTSAPRRRRR
jgi:hypothetical protein